MAAVRKFVGIIIVIIGGVLALTALLGFSVDKGALLSAIQAPLFESSLRVLLDSHRLIFTITSFVLVFFIIICAMIAFGKGTTHIGFTIMIVALCAGFSAWPHGTPFMLIVLFGAHWIAMSELRSSAPIAQAPTPADPAARTPAHDPQPEAVVGEQGGSAADQKQARGAKRLVRRFFH